ncbi:MAG: hypothetical protein ACE5F9_11340 [Phycisphaerae bacterium]
MAESEDNTTPEPVPLADADVDRLLREAEVLTEEIVSETGAERPDPDGAADAAGTIEAGDAIAAVEDAEQKILQLEDVLGAADEAASTSQVAAETDDESPPVVDQVARAPTSEPGEEYSPESSPSAPDAPTEGPAPSGPQVEHNESGVDISASPEGADAASLMPPLTAPESDTDAGAEPDTPVAADDNTADNPDDEGSTETDVAVDESASVPAAKRTIRQVAVAALRAGRRVFLTAMLALPNAFLRTLIVLDRPFAGLSPQAKRRIGLIGLVTLLMGLASILLPSLLHHNPYADIGPYLK